MGCTQSKGDDLAVIGKSARQTSKNVERAQAMYTNSNNNQKTDVATYSSDDIETLQPQLNSNGHLVEEEVVKRTTCSKKVETATLGNHDEGPHTITEIKYAYLTQRGFYPDNTSKPNQDAYSITLGLGGEEGDAMFAVYDGHGSHGHDCAIFAKKQLPKSVAKFVRQKRSQQHIQPLKAEGKSTKGAWNPKLWPMLDDQTYEDCCRKGFLETNKLMHDKQNVSAKSWFCCCLHRALSSLYAYLLLCYSKLDDKLSGTTAVSVNFHKGRMTVCNVGDSRVLLGHRLQNGSMLPIPLTRDQTPFRKDERERVKTYGAEIKSIDQLDGKELMHDDWGDMVHGANINERGDPPRIFLKGKNFPGTAFTRSIGDSVAEDIGVISDPEVVTKALTESDEYLVIATDGVFEFLTNKQVMEIVEECSDPIKACEAVHQAAYKKWEVHEHRTDDITVIVCFLTNQFRPTAEEENGTTRELIRAEATTYGTPSMRAPKENANGKA
eukprot:scaffold22583_cov106-Cylindrotheca_fusiformis.AAC.19